MTDLDLETENVQILTGLWRRLSVGRVDPVRIGLNSEAAQVLMKLDERQVARAAHVHVPLFDFACTSETLHESFKSARAENPEPNEDGQLFLSNRWRASEGSFVAAQMVYNMTRSMHTVMREATFPKIIAAANSNLNLLKLAVRPQYLFHAGAKFDLPVGQRTALAICNSLRTGR